MVGQQLETEHKGILAQKRWFTIDEAGEYVCLSRWSIMGEIKKRRLPAVRYGKRVMLDRLDLDRFMESLKE